MYFRIKVFALVLFCARSAMSGRTILTLIVEGGTKECFHETVHLNKHNGNIDFQFSVFLGGAQDIDVTLEDSDGQIHFSGERQQFGSLNWNVTTSGLLNICFSNEFSTLTSKYVYFELEVYEVSSLPSSTSSDRLEDAQDEDWVWGFIDPLRNIENQLDKVYNLQRAYKLANLRHSRIVGSLNERIQWNAGLVTLAILLVSIGQVFLLKRYLQQKQTKSIVSTQITYPFTPISNSAGYLTTVPMMTS